MVFFAGQEHLSPGGGAGSYLRNIWVNVISVTPDFDTYSRDEMIRKQFSMKSYNKVGWHATIFNIWVVNFVNSQRGIIDQYARK